MPESEEKKLIDYSANYPRMRPATESEYISIEELMKQHCNVSQKYLDEIRKENISKWFILARVACKIQERENNKGY